MKIKKQLPQFTDNRTLLIVTGQQHANLYIVNNGAINQVSEFKIPNPDYSDNEGFLKSTGGGKTIRSGTLKESLKMYVETKFAHQLHYTIDTVLKETKNITGIYAFCPDYMSNIVNKAIPSYAKSLLHTVFTGNYTDNHPFEFLEIVQQWMTENLGLGQKVPRKKEARKLLEKFPHQK